MPAKKYNKVVINDKTIIDLTSDTVTSETLLAGYIAHSSNGSIIVGTAKGLDSTNLIDYNNENIIDSNYIDIIIDTAYVNKSIYGDVITELSNAVRQYEELVDIYNTRIRYCILDSNYELIGI